MDTPDTIPQAAGAFRRSALLGLFLAAILLAGPVTGAWVMRRLRTGRHQVKP